MPSAITVCTNCHTPFEYNPQDVLIEFPEDLEGLIACADKSIGSIPCPECKHPFFAARSIVIAGVHGDVLLLTADPAIRAAYEQEASAQKTTCRAFTERTDFHEAVLEWLFPYIQCLPAAYEELNDPKAGAAPFEPLTLAMLQLTAEGALPFDLPLQNGTVDLAGFLPVLLQQIVFRIYNHCANANEILQFPHRIAERIPVICITQPLLDWFLNLPKYPPEEGFAAFQKEWSKQFITATLHERAGKENPHAQDFTGLISQVWDFGEPGDKRVAGHCFLNETLGQRLLSFEILFRLSMGKLGKPSLEENLATLAKTKRMMAFYGWTEEYNRVAASRIMLKFPEDIPIGKIADVVFETRIRKFPFSPDGKAASRIAAEFAAELQPYLNGGNIPLCQLLVSRAASAAATLHDCSSSILICIQAARLFREAGEPGSAWVLVQKVRTDFPTCFESLTPTEKMTVLLETGNVAREWMEIPLAGQSLDEAERLIPLLDQSDRPAARTVITRNRALCLRDQGDFAGALTLLEEVVKIQPADFPVALNLAQLYIRVNRYAEALQVLTPFVTMRALSLSDEQKFHLTMAWASNGVGDRLTCQMHLEAACKDYNRYPFLGKCEVVNVILFASLPDTDIKDWDTLERANELIGKGRVAGETHPLFFTTVYLTIGRLLRDKQIEQASKLVAADPSLLTKKGDWRFEQILAAYHFAIGDYVNAEARLSACIAAVNDVIPKGANIGFTIDWFADKEEIQRSLLSIIKGLLDAHVIDIFTFLDVLEFCYGRELTARLLPGQAAPGAKQTIDVLAERFPDAEFFLFFELNEGIHFINISPGQHRIIIAPEPVCSIAEAEQINQRATRAFKQASPSPALLKYTDNQLAGMNALFARMGRIFEQWIDSTTTRVYFLTGRTFNNLPLHLVPVHGQTLIEYCPVGYFSNLASLSVLETKAAVGSGATLVTVTKDVEKAGYTEAAIQTTERLQALIQQKQQPVKVITQQEGTIDHTLTALASSSEAVFLCHGTTGARQQGAGICLAYHGQLPTEFISLRSSVSSKFLLTWEALEGHRMPPLLVSTACSSGKTIVGAGGVQLGFEQSFFAQGGVSLISPLWDVCQASTLFWLERFFESRLQCPTLDSIGHYRAACLETKQKFDHPFFWAPFIFKGI